MLTIYSKNNCGHCMMAKAMLKNNDIAFEEINVEENAEAYEFLISEGHRTMPQIYKDGKLFIQGGYQGLQNMGIPALREQLEKDSINTDTLGTL